MKANLSDYRNFSVQAYSEIAGWDNDTCYLNWTTAKTRAEFLKSIGVTTRIFGHHKTAKGGACNRIVWDSREA